MEKLVEIPAGSSHLHGERENGLVVPGRQGRADLGGRPNEAPDHLRPRKPEGGRQTGEGVACLRREAQSGGGGLSRERRWGGWLWPPSDKANLGEGGRV